MVTPVSHTVKHAALQVNVDPAMTEPEGVARCLTEGLAEVLALSGSDTETNPPTRSV
jgi:hypothetical protein